MCLCKLQFTLMCVQSEGFESLTANHFKHVIIYTVQGTNAIQTDHVKSAASFKTMVLQIYMKWSLVVLQCASYPFNIHWFSTSMYSEGLE